jgi:iron complex transport system permease protein
MGIVVGGALALTGVVLQGVFRNPMADPQLLGIGPGASLGGVIGSVAGATPGAIAGGAVAGLLTALVVRRLGARRANQPSRFILTGVALSAALSAWVGFVVFGADRAKVPPIEFWLLGSLTGSTWRALSTAVLLVGLGSIGLWTGARILDLMALGESEARHLGVDVEFATTVLLMGTGIVTGAAVGAVGVVGFVGLLVPHVVRKLTGPAHRPLMLGSVLAGGLFVVVTDLVARTVFVPIEIPVGLVTAVVGGPFFLWLIRKARY